MLGEVRLWLCLFGLCSPGQEGFPLSHGWAHPVVELFHLECSVDCEFHHVPYTLGAGERGQSCFLVTKVGEGTIGVMACQK